MDDGQSPKYEWFQICSRFIKKKFYIICIFFTEETRRTGRQKKNYITQGYIVIPLLKYYLRNVNYGNFNILLIIYINCKTKGGNSISLCYVARLNFGTWIKAHNLRFLYAVSKDCISNNPNLFQHVEISVHSAA